MIHSDCFAVNPSDYLPDQIRKTIAKMMNDEEDSKVYSKTSLLKCDRTLHLKEVYPGKRLFKVPIPRSLVYEMNASIIHAYATAPKSCNLESKYGEPIEDITEIIPVDNPAVYQLTKVVEPKNFPLCIKEIWESGPQEGSRHYDLWALVSHMRRYGFPSEWAKLIALSWNRSSLSTQEIMEQVEYQYNKEYRYGCKSKVLERHCNVECMYYQNKNYDTDILNLQDFEKQVLTFYSKDLKDSSINIAARIGRPEKNSIIYPGEVVVLVGNTGSGKSTWLANLLMGYDPISQEVRSEWKLRTLWYDLESAPRLIWKRCLQIATGISEVDFPTEVSEVKKFMEENRHYMDHLIIQKTRPLVTDIRDHVKSEKPKVVAIDFFDLLLTKKSKGIEKVEEIMHTLQILALEEEIIVLVVAQPPNDEAKAGKRLTLHSSRGSGAITHLAHTVLVFNGDQYDPNKDITIGKMRDGESGYGTEFVRMGNSRFRLVGVK